MFSNTIRCKRSETLRKDQREGLKHASSTCSHGVLEVLVVADGAQQQARKHEDGQGVALGRRLPVVHHPKQQVDKNGGHELAGVIHQLEGYGGAYQPTGGLPTSLGLHLTRKYVIGDKSNRCGIAIMHGMRSPDAIADMSKSPMEDLQETLVSICMVLG